MLGRCPCPPTFKGELHTHSHEIVHLPSSADEEPVLQPPHQIVIGFDLGAGSSRNSLSQASCESPRSVLEPHHLCFRAHHQHSRSPRFPLSALGSLLSGQPRNAPCTEGAALCVKVAIKAEEVAVGSNVYHSFSRRGHVACDVDGAVSYHNCLKRDHIACDVGHSNANLESKPVTFSRTDYVGVKPWNHGSSEHAGVRQNQPWNHDPRECMSHGSRHSKAFPSSDCEDEDSDDAAAADADGEGVDIRTSIFSPASPVSDYSRQDSPAVDFLSTCFLCRRHLSQGKDIYMYRGDRAFCSQECRHQQIVVDKRKERCPAVVACISGDLTHHGRVRRAAQAAVS